MFQQNLEVEGGEEGKQAEEDETQQELGNLEYRSNLGLDVMCVFRSAWCQIRKPEKAVRVGGSNERTVRTERFFLEPRSLGMDEKRPPGSAPGIATRSKGMLLASLLGAKGATRGSWHRYSLVASVLCS